MRAVNETSHVGLRTTTKIVKMELNYFSKGVHHLLFSIENTWNCFQARYQFSCTETARQYAII